MRRKRKILLHCNIAAVFLLALLFHPAAAGGGPVTVRIGFGGAFLPGAWTPVAIEIDPDAAPVRGTVEISLPRRAALNLPPERVHYLLPYALSDGAPLRRWISLPLQSGEEPLVVRLLGEEGTLVAEERVSLSGAASYERLVAVLDPAEEAWAWVASPTGGERAQANGRIAVGHAPDPRDFPDHALSLKPLTAIAVRAGFPLHSLTRAQRKAIEEYVLSGGHLVLSGGAAPPAFPAEWRSWLPAAATGRVVAYSFAGISVPGWELAASESDAMLTWEGRPFAASFAAGDGRVTFVAVDPSSPLARSPSLEKTLRELITAQQGAARDPFLSYSGPSHWDALEAYPTSPRPPSGLAWWLTVYTAVCTFLAAWASRRTPALAALALWIAAGAVFATAYANSLGLRDRIGYREVQVTEGSPTGRGWVRAYASIIAFNPATEGDTFALEGAAFPFPREFQPDLPPVRLAEGSAFLTRLPPSTPVDFYYEVPVETGVALSWRGDSRLVLSNESGHRLWHVFLVERGRYAHLGSVEPHAAIEVEYPPGSWIVSSFVSQSIQSHLARNGHAARPDEVELRLVASAVEQTLAASRGEARFVVALAEPLFLAMPSPADSVERRRVLVVPLPQRGAGGGASDAR